MDNTINETISENNRPFFSIIIPCYNSKPNLIYELLCSIARVHNSNDTEVIIVDDRSENKEFLEVVKEFNKNSEFEGEYKYNKFEDHDPYKLNIIVTEVPDTRIDLIHCPGNTREAGVKLATGEWITFVDHDDLLINDSFTKVKNAIIEGNEQYIASANFIEINPISNEIGRNFIHTANWMHAKFYNLDNFWKAFDFHFSENLCTHEDIAISSKVNCVLYKLGKQHPFYIEDFVYVWRSWPDSTSRSMYDGRLFIDTHFIDYVRSTIDVYKEDYIEFLDKNKDRDEEYKNRQGAFYAKMYIDVILYMYFYIQAFKFYNKYNYDMNNIFIAKSKIREFYRIFNLSPEMVLQLVSENGWYNSIRDSAKNATGNIVEYETFYDFIAH